MECIFPVSSADTPRCLPLKSHNDEQERKRFRLMTFGKSINRILKASRSFHPTKSSFHIDNVTNVFLSGEYIVNNSPAWIKYDLQAKSESEYETMYKEISNLFTYIIIINIFTRIIICFFNNMISK